MSRIYWNNDWLFLENVSKEKCVCVNWDDSKSVRLPHTTKETPLHYFDESMYQMECAYKKTFVGLEEWKNKTVLLTVEAAGHVSAVFLNGVLLGEHFNGYTSFSVDMTKEIKTGEENELIIWVNSKENQNIPPFGKVIDYMTFGGLYREVYIDVLENEYISDVFVKPERLGDGRYKLHADVSFSNGITVCDYDGVIPNTNEELSLSIKLKQCGSYEENKNDLWKTDLFLKELTVNEWSIENPNLYELQVSLLKAGEVIDVKSVRFGFRKASFKADGFYLNGQKVTIRGLNRHQSYPYVGYASPKSMQIEDARILKEELKVNAVRTSHYPQSHHFLDACDELGLLVFTEIPGWQHLGDKQWKEQAVINTKEMVLQYRNHPSIILWGTRINESEDEDELYTKTNKVAKELDSTRQTSGVRFIQKSNLIEDVYAFNDFSHDGTTRGCQPKSKTTTDMNKGFLISEFNGHMFPTKAFDTEDKRVEHMLRHARVMDAYYGEAGIAGGFGWCMFDYNTHKDFGSGDRICYHGVMDAFRNPKMAAYLYEAQTNDDVVLEVTSAMEVGEHPACLLPDVYAITNADSVKFYKNGKFVGEFGQDKKVFKNLPNSPIIIDDLIGNLMEEDEGFSHKMSEEVKYILMAAGKHGLSNLPLKAKLLAAKCIAVRHMSMSQAVELYNKYIGNWGGEATVYRFEAIKNGEVVKVVEKSPMKTPQLEVKVSHTTLKEENTYDMASVRIRALSEKGNLLDFANEPLSISASGPIEIVGPKLISLNGGMGGFYIKTKGEPGKASVIINSPGFETQTIELNVEC